MQWITFKDKLVAYGKVKYVIRKMAIGGYYVAEIGLDKEYFESQRQAISYCNKYDIEL